MAKTRREGIDSEIGQSLTLEMIQNSPSRAAGLVTRGGAEWDEAFDHIRLHFHPMDKPVHGIL